MGDMTKKSLTVISKNIMAKYASYKIGDIAMQLYMHNASDEDIAYILQDGETVETRPYEKLQTYLAGAMNRLSERMPSDAAIQLRRDSACCLSGKRETLARAICKNYATIDERFEALSNERYIVGGKGWKEGENFFISYWWDVPKDGYTCGCLKHTPHEPMNKLWCECCVGHIQHHFDIALGVESSCECVSSALTSCGNQPCTFKFNIVKVLK